MNAQINIVKHALGDDDTALLAFTQILERQVHLGEKCIALQEENLGMKKEMLEITRDGIKTLTTFTRVVEVINSADIPYEVVSALADVIKSQEFV